MARVGTSAHATAEIAAAAIKGSMVRLGSKGSTGALIALVEVIADDACAGVLRQGIADVTEDDGSTSPVDTKARAALTCSPLVGCWGL